VCASQLPASAAEALAAVRAGLAYLNGMDAAGLAGPVQAQCLRELARAESAQTAAQARVLSAFRASSASEADGQGSADVAAVADPDHHRRGRRRGGVDAPPGRASRAGGRLAGGSISPSWARAIAAWTDQLPEAHRSGADEILLAAAAGGAGLAELAGLAQEIRSRGAAPDADGPGPGGMRRGSRAGGCGWA
jgi:hypothetical protein